MTTNMERKFVVIREPEPIAYNTMFTRQMERHLQVAEGTAPNTLFLLEHTPVVTLGKDADEANLLLTREGFAKHSIEVLEASRGGDVTYHGPGQLIAYPIMNLNHWKLSVGWYLRTLEAVLIDVLSDYALHGERVEGLTGVWVKGAKVAAIGIGLRKWCTIHGIALNIQPDMSHFGYIVPCGIVDKPVTSLAQLLEEAPSFEDVSQRFEQHFRKHFAL